MSRRRAAFRLGKRAAPRGARRRLSRAAGRRAGTAAPPRRSGSWPRSAGSAFLLGAASVAENPSTGLLFFARFPAAGCGASWARGPAAGCDVVVPALYSCRGPMNGSRRRRDPRTGRFGRFWYGGPDVGCAAVAWTSASRRRSCFLSRAGGAPRRRRAAPARAPDARVCFCRVQPSLLQNACVMRVKCCREHRTTCFR